MHDIAYDARWHGAFGIGRYSHELRSRLTGNVYDIVAPGDPVGARGLFEWERTTRRAHRQKRILLSPSFTPSRLWPGPQAITVHDLIHLDVFSESSRPKKLYYERHVKPAIRRNDVTFTVSEFSKNRLVEWTGVESDRIVVTGNAADTRFSPEGRRHEPNYPYIFSVRSSKPHKNTPRLISAFAELPRDDVHLVLSGHPDADSLAAASRGGVSDRVVFEGLIPDAVLPNYYRGASVVAFTSLYEGFGIPAIEAMACGTPLVASSTTSLPEVTGGAALLVDPSDVMEIARALSRALTDDRLRKGLREAALGRAAQFSWEDIASTVMQTLSQIR